MIGSVPVPTPVPAGTFPLIPDYPLGTHIEPVFTIHRFLTANAKIEQRFKLGRGVTVWQVSFREVTQTEMAAVRSFWAGHLGAFVPFTFMEPQADGTTVARTVVFADQPLSFEQLRDWISGGTVTLIEWPTTFPTYTVSTIADRYPSAALETALTGQVQELVQLVTIRPLEPGYPPIYLADRKCTLHMPTTGDAAFNARLVTHSGLGQTVGGSSDFIRLTFGNADRIMTKVAESTDLYLAAVQFSLFHVATGTLIEIWKGIVDNYRPNSDTEWVLECLDGAADLGQQYPMRRIMPLCGKKYNDPLSGCPWSSVSGTLDLVHFPSASSATCDRGYATANGCLAHQMKRYYGGIQIDPQTVRIKNQDTGWFGFGRAMITSTSMVSDSAMGQPLAKIITDVPIPVPCQMIAGRDEGDFYEALALVGEGPLTFGRGSYDSAGNRRMHTLDGQPNHGDPGPLGLREIPGTDPAGASDWFSLDQSGNQTGGDWRKVYSGNSTYLDNFVAKVAFVVIRRADEKGFQLTTLDEHNVIAIVAGGLTGPGWTAPGIRTTVNLTNPIWFAVTLWLEAHGLLLADSATQEKVLDLPSLIVAATICDTQVPRLIGSGMETQFKFMGLLRDIKPLKDWLQEVLNNCLGDWLISNGKLKVVIRQDSAAEASFTAGNIVYGTLMLGPIRPAFNRMTVNFANSDYDFVADAIQIRDNDNIDLTRRTRDGYLNLSGSGTKSQAGRIGSVRLREELGGITPAEWKAAREGGFKTTVLALGMELMKGLSIDDPDVPSGRGIFRCTTWTLNPDMSLDIAIRTTTDSMYDLIVGPKAVDVPSNPLPVEFYPFPLKSAWCPNVATYGANDQYFSENQRTFRLEYAYRDQADAGKQALVLVTGEAAVNDTLVSTVPPTVTGQGFAHIGGTLETSRDYFAQVACRDADGRWSPPSNIRRIHFGGSSVATGQITVSGIIWPGGTWAAGVLFVGVTEQTMCAQVEVLGPLPAGFTFNGPWKPATYNAPSPVHRNVRIKVKRIIHGGVVGTQVVSVDQPANEILLAGPAATDASWMGRVLSVIARADDGPVPPTNFAILEHNTTTGLMELYPPMQPGEVAPGDLVYIRMLPTTLTSTTIGDARLVNAVYPSGLEPDAEKGLIVRGIKGGYPHQLRTVVSNTQTVYTLDRPWDFYPEYFIVEGPAWDYQSDGSQIPVPRLGSPQTIECTVTNIGQQILVAGFLVDRNENETDEEWAVVRDGYLFGAEGDATGGGGGAGVKLIDVVNPPADHQLDVDDGDQFVSVTATTKDVTIILPDEDQMDGKRVTVKAKALANGHKVFVKPFPDGDTIEGSTATITIARVDEQKTWAAS